MSVSGILEPLDQLRVLAAVWGKHRSGYVFLPWIDGDAKTKDSRRRGYHEGKAYKWPADRKAILEHLKSHQSDDLYFSVNLFKGKRRIEQQVQADAVMFADLDPVDPTGLADRPTIAWESSPDRYQGIWIMDQEREGASQAGRENHRLTAYIKADPSGWDSTQLLRVPGRPNYKFDYVAEDEPNGVEGRGVLWVDGPRYTWSDFDELPVVESRQASITDNLDESVLEGIDKHAVWGRIKLRVSSRTRELYVQRILPMGLDRSDVMWEMARDFADAGASSLEIVKLLKMSVWNKYEGRSDELVRLMTTAQRAVNERKELDPIIEDEKKPSRITWLSDVVAKPIPRPKWLVKDIWTQGGCGFISGAPKSYKSWMALDLAVSVATGSPWMNQETFKVHSESPVLYLQEEDDLRLVMERLATITESKAPDRFWNGQLEVNIDPDADPFAIDWKGPSSPIPLGMHVQTGFIASDPGWQSWLDEVIEENQFALVIIDTLGTTAGDIDTDSSGEMMNRLLKPLKVLAQKHNTAITVVHHNKKSAGQGRAGNDMLGSVALHAWVDCAIYARSKDIDGVVSVEREAKLAQDRSIRFKIPFMFEDVKTGKRVLWDPEEVIPDVGQDQAAPTPAKRSTRKAGQAIANKLKMMGSSRAHPIDRIAAVLDKPEAELITQLTQAEESGLVAQKEDGKWQYIG